MTRDYEEYLKDDNLHINWYPGHMAKTKKMLEEKMDRWEYLVELAAKIAGQQS